MSTSKTMDFYPVNSAALANFVSGSKTFGPITITYNIDLSIPQVQITVTLYGVTIGQATINPQHPKVQIGGSVGIAKAQVDLTLKGKQIDYTIDVEAFGKTLYKGNGMLFSW